MTSCRARTKSKSRVLARPPLGVLPEEDRQTSEETEVLSHRVVEVTREPTKEAVISSGASQQIMGRATLHARDEVVVGQLWR